MGKEKERSGFGTFVSGISTATSEYV